MDTLITLTMIIIPYPCPTLDKEAQNLNSPARVLRRGKVVLAQAQEI